MQSDEIPVNNGDRSFEALIIAFYSVEDFFIQTLAHKSQSYELAKDMMLFYSAPFANTLEYFVSLEIVRDLEGALPCAVFWRNSWMRATAFACSINKLSIKDSLVFVRLVDVGITDTARLVNIRRLPMRFATLPVLVHRAYLPNVLKPVHSDFLVQKCRAYVDKKTFNMNLTIEIADDKEGFNQYRHLGKTPVNVYIRHNHKSDSVLDESSIKEPQGESLAEYLLDLGLALPNISNSVNTNGESSTSGSTADVCTYREQLSDCDLSSAMSCSQIMTSNEDETIQNVNKVDTDSERMASMLRKCVISFEKRLISE